MEGQGDCRVAPYSVSKSYGRIMQRLRPIAPKPAPSAAAGGSSSGGSSVDSNKSSWRRRTRGGRSNITVSEKKRNIARCLTSRTPEEEMDRVTIPLLPPPDDHKGNYCSRVVCSNVTDDAKEGKRNSMRSGDENYDLDPGFAFPMTKLPCNGSLAPGGDGAFMVVECVADTWVEGDKGRVMSLREDAVRASYRTERGGVRWSNEAFRRMVVITGGDKGGGGGGVRERQEEVGWAEVGAGTETGTGRSFASRVRMLCTWLGMKMGPITTPCDVWRLDGGDFAWRLDVGAALDLGR